MFIVELIRFGRKELYSLRCGYNAEFVENVKKIHWGDRSFNSVDKCWEMTAKGLYLLIQMYRGRTDIKFEFENEKQREQFVNIIKKHKNRVIKQVTEYNEMVSFDNDFLKYREELKDIVNNFDYTKYLKDGIVPMEHQIYGALFAKRLLENDKNVLLAMGLGTGKTLTAILAIQMMEDVKKCLFIVPANLRLNVQNEVHLFTNEYCYVPNVLKNKEGKYYFSKYKRNEGRDISDCKYIVLSYDYFSSSDFDCNKRILDLGLHEIDVIVYDEFHFLSNKKSNRSENIKRSYSNIVKREMGLSATPLKGNLTKFYPLLNKLKPQEFKNQTNYNKDICGLRYYKKPDAYRAEWHQDYEPRLDLLNQKLQTFTYRVKTEDVIKDLPPLTVERVVLEMTPKQKKEYNEIEKGLAKVSWGSELLFLDDDERNNSAMGIMMQLRQYTASIKMEHTIKLVRELNEYGEKCIVFDMFKKPLFELKDKLGNDSEIYSGDQSLDRKQQLVDLFQDKDSYLNNLLISLIAGNAGITLTQSSHAIQQTLSLVPAENSQAWGRIHRKGQTKPSTIYLPTVADTIDDIIYETLYEKNLIISAVIDGEEYKDVSEKTIINDLVLKLKEKWQK